MTIIMIMVIMMMMIRVEMIMMMIYSDDKIIAIYVVLKNTGKLTLSVK